MFQRDRNTTVHTCPNCGRELKQERGELRCAEHGAFFAYGPNLLVRAPREESTARILLPWEKASTSAS